VPSVSPLSLSVAPPPVDDDAPVSSVSAVVAELEVAELEVAAETSLVEPLDVATVVVVVVSLAAPLEVSPVLVGPAVDPPVAPEVDPSGRSPLQAAAKQRARGSTR